MLIFVLAIASCSTAKSTDANQKPSMTSTNSPSTPTEAEKVNLEAINNMRLGISKLAKNDLEVEFLDIAFNSCKKALEDGFVIKDPDSTSYFISSADSQFYPFKTREVSVTDGKVGGPKYLDWPPFLFDACGTLIQANFVKPSDVNYLVLEHSIEKTGDGSYKWGQHHGAANLDVTTFNIGTDGLISGYGAGDWNSEVRYGPLTETELGYFK